ncbi:MAG TPA: Frizzy aggregation protein FrzB [Myxococcales bacterium]|jgi:hypothetical protein|nr:Frizzy aggregation protein FrzB [Myxococcales bacterium]
MSEASVEVLFFQIDGTRMGADASQVLRIEAPGAPGDVPGAITSSLGSARPRRALVFRAGDGEGTLGVDSVLGVQAVPQRDLRRVPRAARVAAHAIGFFLDGDRPILLIDLPRTLHPFAPPHARAPAGKAT